jgi:hypothetical protein
MSPANDSSANGAAPFRDLVRLSEAQKQKARKDSPRCAKLLSGKSVRFVDIWRKAAARPLKPVEMSNTHRPGTGTPFPDAVWTFVYGKGKGQQTWRWREGDMPGFAWFLQERFFELSGAWHVARTELAMQKKRKRGANTTASRRKLEAATRYQELRRVARKVLAEEPDIKMATLAAMLSERGFGGKEAIRKLLPKLRVRTKSRGRSGKRLSQAVR